MVLREVASRFRGVLRENELVARLGGDEFIVLLPNITDDAEHTVVGDPLIAALQPNNYGKWTRCSDTVQRRHKPISG